MLKKIKPSVWIILLFIVSIPFVNFNHHKYQNKEGVIEWDIKSYYAYLPAAIIHKDLSLGFMDEDPKTYSKWIWPVTTPTGNKAILTTMGLSILYSPFFLIAHTYAHLSDKYEADGYSLPYHVALTFSAYFYFLLALFFLRRILLKFFSEFATAFTLLVMGAGTNLFYYITYEAPMSHAFNFTLIIVFIYVLNNWWEEGNKWRQTIILGLISGLIALIRPTNIIVVLLIPLWGISHISELKENFRTLLKNWPKVILMAFCFIIVWIPQMIYWYKVAGTIFYFSYGEVDSHFYFNNPQIFSVLFSYKKGLFIYTPILFVSTISIIILFIQKRKQTWAVLIYFLVNLYILSSWWSWWFGGGFSNRAFIDSYGLMAFPIAALLDHWKSKNIFRYLALSVLLILTGYNLFQSQQYRYVAIHYWWNNREVYWENFLKVRPTCKSWNIYNQPDVLKARKGIYEAIPFVDNHVSREDLYNKVEENTNANKDLLDNLMNIALEKNSTIEEIKKVYINDYIASHKAINEYKELRIAFLKEQIYNCYSWKKEIEKKARKTGQSFDDIANSEAERIFKKYSQKYIK